MKIGTKFKLTWDFFDAMGWDQSRYTYNEIKDIISLIEGNTQKKFWLGLCDHFIVDEESSIRRIK